MQLESSADFSVAGDINTSVQIPPPPGTQFQIYILEQEQPEANGKLYYLHFVTTQRFNRVRVNISES